MRIEAAAPVSLSCSSRLNLVLYGLDKSIADLPATVVRSHVGTIDALPLEFDLQVPANPHDVIPATLEDARFYFAVKIDADGNGQICPGDYDLDYDLTGGPLYVTFPVTETIVVPVAML